MDNSDRHIGLSAAIGVQVIVTALSGVGYSERNELNRLPDSVVTNLFHEPCSRSLIGRRVTAGRSLLPAVTVQAVQRSRQQGSGRV